ncbi:MAG: DNA translocase FtsK, partial [Erysipelotrichaceae bacterium]|nr:DNA translocase FtsK [Erysipelotrichaceae bacterium]
FSLLDPIKGQQGSNANQVAASESGRKVIEILKNFGVNAELVATHIGPSVTKFEIKPDSSVKVSRINAIQDNIKMELAARDIRIEAPIPGKTAVGIEIPNIEAVPVKMLELVKSIPMEKMDQKLLFVLGKDLLGKPVYCQLDKMPHLLIAGATGSGKSVCMNTIITSFLLRCHPDEVKLLLIDPKKVEFTPYQQIPHLIAPVISDAAKASSALKVIVTIMEERFDVFAQCGVRNIKAYNEKVAQDSTGSMQNMPYIVVIIDELADLMSVAGKEVEVSIQRITQLARASGIHLIVATQRPSTDVVTGIIKSNIPSRISFSVASGIDSRTILDQVGAERLLGNGDMLYVPIGEPSMIRLQGVYVTDEEVNRIASYCSDLRKPMYLDNFIKLETLDSDDNGGIISANEDPLYEEVKEYVIDVQKASTSLLQRRFGIGYNRAARMIDILESNGIIGPVQGSKPREVYIKKEQID